MQMVVGARQRAGVWLLALMAASALSLSVGGCASSGLSADNDSFLLPDPDADSQAEGAAFTATSMHLRQPMPKHKPNEDNDWDFYFKHCSSNGHGRSSGSHFSKTSYDCSGPYY